MINARMDSGVIVVTLRPLEFELPGFSSRLEFKAVLDRYIRTDHRFDIWLKRSPVHPRVTVVRHSDYTPHRLLMRTAFYKRTLRHLDAEHGASLVVWRAETWLATITVLRTGPQGDFSAEDLAFLRMLQPHVALAVKRQAAGQEENLVRKSLDAFADNSSQGVIALNWNLDVLYFNRAAREMSRRWSDRPRRKGSNGILLGLGLLDAVRKLKPRIEAARPNRPSTPRHLKLHALFRQHEGERSVARISFVPAKALSYSKGSFLIVMSNHGETARAGRVRFDQLSRREAECVKHVGTGMTNTMIARKLGVSPLTVRNQLSSALRKLGLKNRYEVAAAVIRAAKTD